MADVFLGLKLLFVSFIIISHYYYYYYYYYYYHYYYHLIFYKNELDFLKAIFVNFEYRLFKPIIKYIYAQLMSRDTSRTTTKSKMEVSAMKGNGETFIFTTVSPTPDSTAVLDRPADVLKDICLKLLYKLNEITELQMYYLYTEKPGSQFPPTKYAKKRPPGRVTLVKKQVHDLHFYLKLHP